MPAYFESGFFVRKAAWHQLGNVVERPPQNAKDALELSGLDWEVWKLPMYVETPEGSRIKTDDFALVRDTDERVLGTCKGPYVPFQNKEAMEWCEPLLDTEMWSMETGGSLREGEICWVLLKQDEDQVVPNDVYKQYLLLSWAHNAKRSIQVFPTSVRVVCANTLSLALNSDRTFRFSVRHNSKLERKMDAIQDLHKETTLAFSIQQDLFKVLVDVDWKEEQMKKYVDSLFPFDEIEDGLKKTNERKKNKAFEKMLLNEEASGTKELGIGSTAYGAFMAASEFNEHFLSPNSKDRGMRILWGEGGEFNKKALKSSLEISNLPVSFVS